MRPLRMTTPTDTTIEIVRSFDAPRPLVWRAHTEPALVKRWLTGPSGHTMPECEIDLRIGGTYRYVWEWPDGRMSATGRFREIETENRLLLTEIFDVFPDNETLVEQLFTERDGQTFVTMNLHYDSKATRDGVLKSPMDEGLEASYRSLDALVSGTV
ncbi:SRPBCC family protein [Hoeflea prorocentri]|uniref:SRPBCC family protein n=1 Tax=Hoeflea prorocentri TaxID=1922333 RepID=A0A9X3ZJ14_9HYPH|nr:SRPBCC family protein [Hoeflea prorocentri]MCY6383487.1 SRPBCC family protein [Hoeflea prorocentri]MDA5401287.1 SRPBCC family protein [Hoeflea prorocentri]